MIAWLHGKIQGRGENYVVLLVGGSIGYKVFLPPRQSLWEKVQKDGAELELYTVQTFSENDQRLYGFESWHEKRLFEVLLGVSGIGPKHASELLGHIDSRELVGAVLAQDAARISSVPGIGKKTAARLLVELKDKLVEKGLADGVELSGRTDISKVDSERWSELKSTLLNLGFSAREAEKMLKNSEKDLADTSSIEEALKLLLRTK